ncbi:M56 family metallopeptidase [Sandaracinobacter sp. RS1-74]|uniref:M56 family metallopeptidase n=1 Tax=Sandaracinobacteroides sayramensis TaxID=2913411 RepID=UPI001EDA4E1B|nr:M56 family metallopeptidase [Sandaracinobacteroides sayramensis]MCG2840520.1 M56 family metallopeptidase [Sandaracinobacteroides sayramensis]
MTPAFFLEMGWKSALVVLLGLSLLLLLRHRSAADRVFLLRLTVFLLLALPLAAAFGPKLEVEQPAALAGLAPAHAPALAPVGARLAPADETMAVAAVETGALLDWPFLLLVVYGLGVGAVLSHLATGIWTLRQWTRNASPVVHPLWDAAEERAKYRTGVKRPVRVLQSADVPAPLGWGLRRPAILLDRRTVKRDEQAEAVLAHEYAHIAGGDWPMLILSRLALALFWFNPLVWLLDRRLAEQSEEAADMTAVRRLDPGSYAQALLSAVALPPCNALPATPMVASSGLGRRIHRILDDGARNRLSGSLWTVLAGLAVFAGAVSLAMLQIVPAPAVAARPGVPPVQALAPVEAVPQPEDVVAPVVFADQLVETEEPALVADVAVAWPEPETPAPASPPVAVPAAAIAPPPPVPPAPPADMAADVPDAWDVAAPPRPPIPPRPQVRVVVRQQAMQDPALWAMGVTPAYLAQMALAFGVPRISADDAVEMKAMGLSPGFVRGIVAAGYPGISLDELHELIAMGVTPGYIRGLAAAGFQKLSVDELVQLRAVGVTVEFARDAHRKGLAGCADELAELRVSGLSDRVAG